MREPAFWQQPPGAASALLQPLAAVYGAVAARRMRQTGRHPGPPVICIGNLTLGGAGKTPTALHVGALLRDAGARPFFLTRGYGGRLTGPLIVEPSLHSAEEVGDEPLLLARIAPTVLARDRIAGAECARAAGADVLVMDDGFQNPSLAKDLAIIVLDAQRGVGNGQVFPAGPLRAPLPAQMQRAQALVLIGGPGIGLEPVAVARSRGIRVFAARLDPNPDDVAGLSGRKLFAFAGIGDPDKFFATLTTAGLDVRRRRAFPDHHPYAASDAAALLDAAHADGLLLVTTEKDMARLAGRPNTARLAAASRTLGVTLVIDDASEFSALVRSAAQSV